MTDALSEIRRPISYMSEHSNITAWNAKIKNNIDWGGSQKEKQEKLESAMEFWCAIICHFPPKTSCTPCVKGLLYFLLEVYHVYLGPQRFPKHARRLRRSRTWNLGV